MIAGNSTVLTFYNTNILMNLEKIHEMAVKKLPFFQRMQKIPKFNFFLLKKPMQITNKTRQTLYADRLHQKIPLYKKRLPYGNLLKVENPLKFIRKTVRQRADYTHKQNHHPQFSIQEGNTKKQSIIQNPNRPKNAKLKNAKTHIKTPVNPDRNWDNITVPKPSQKTKTGTV